jgi:hypothetical protein
VQALNHDPLCDEIVGFEEPLIVILALSTRSAPVELLLVTDPMSTGALFEFRMGRAVKWISLSPKAPFLSAKTIRELGVLIIFDSYINLITFFPPLEKVNVEQVDNGA